LAKSQQRPHSVTMADVAARAGVSRALVSIVFRGVPGASSATRQRVMQAAEELAYRPDQRARLLGSNRSRTIGIVFGLHHEFHAEVVEALYRSVEITDYDLVLGATAPTRDEHRAVQALLDYRCEALILLGPSLSRTTIGALAERLPVVVVARALPRTPVDVVRTDDFTGARIAVEHLAGLGHTSITHVDGKRAPGAAERRRGYHATMRSLGLQPVLVAGGLTEQDGEQAAAQFLTATPPTAVTAFNDHCAAGLMATARVRGLPVPRALSVVGYDNSQIASLTSVALTTIAQDTTTLAASAFDLAVTRAESGSDRLSPREIVVPPRLVLRHTTAPPLD
jgi:DNA-binding LacI/PurR family transcriptional regulator